MPNDKNTPATMKYIQINPDSGPGKYKTMAPKIFFKNTPKGKTKKSTVKPSGLLGEPLFPPKKKPALS